MRRTIRVGALRGLRSLNSTPFRPSANSLRNHVSRRPSAPPSAAFHSKPPDRSGAVAPAAKLAEAESAPALPPRERLSIADIKERRAKAGRLIAPTAAYSDADMFKAPTTGKPKAKRWDHYLTEESLSREPILEIEEDIFNRCIAKGVLVARGSWFRAEQDLPPSGLYFRTTFAAASPDNMREAIRRLGEAIRESYRIDAGMTSEPLQGVVELSSSTSGCCRNIVTIKDQRKKRTRS
ncbi:hypothetical protein VTH06DRAFT_539 [Thermothelomyces fergusii]